MTVYEIPIANLPIKVVASCALSLVIFVILWFGGPWFLRYLRMLTGRQALPAGLTRKQLAMGSFFFVVLFGTAVFAAFMLLAIHTTPPSVVTTEGVSGGGGPLFSRKTILWNEVVRVDCGIGQDRTVRKLRVLSASKKVEFAGGNDLSEVRDYIWSRIPEGVTRHCAFR